MDFIKPSRYGRSNNKLPVSIILDDKSDKAERRQIARENGFGRKVTAKAPSWTYRTKTNYAKQQYAVSNCTKLLSTICGTVSMVHKLTQKNQSSSKASIIYLRRNFVRAGCVDSGLEQA